MPWNISQTMIQYHKFFSVTSKGFEIGVLGRQIDDGKTNMNFKIFSSSCSEIEQAGVMGNGGAYFFNCAPKNGAQFNLSEFVIFDDSKKEVYWPIDISKGHSEPLDQFIKRTGLDVKAQTNAEKQPSPEPSPPVKKPIPKKPRIVRKPKLKKPEIKVPEVELPETKPSEKKKEVVKKETPKKEPLVKAPPSYTVNFLYPTERQSFTVKKNEHTEAFVYLSVDSNQATDETFQVVYSLGKEEKTISAPALSLEPIVITIPISFVSGTLEIKAVNNSSRVTGRKSIAIVPDAAAKGELSFTQDRSTGVKAKLSPLTSVGGARAVGGEASFDLSEKSPGIAGRTLDLDVGLQKGWGAKFSLEIPIVKEIANAGVDIAGSLMSGSTYEYQYENFKDMISAENYKKFEALIPYFVKARQNANFLPFCKDFAPESELGKSHSFMPDCATVGDLWIKNRDEYERIKADYDEVSEDLQQELKKRPERLQKSIAIFSILLEGYRLFGDRTFETWLAKAFRNPEYGFTEADFKSVLTDLKRSDSTLKDVSAEFSLSAEAVGLSAKASGKLEQVKESSTLFQDPDEYNSKTTIKQSMVAKAAVSGNVLKPLLKKISSKALNRLLRKLTSSFREGQLCNVMKVLMSKKGIIPSVGNYSDDCRGLNKVLEAGYSVDISFDSADVKSFFEKSGLDITDLQAQLIANFLTGSDFNLIGLTKYPEETSYSVSEYRSGSNLKRVIFSVASHYPSAADDHGTNDEYVFTSLNGGVLPQIPDFLLISNQFEKYLQDSEIDPNIGIELNHYEMVPETESDTDFSIGWGVQLTHTEKTAHEIKVLTEHSEQDQDGNLRRVSLMEPAFLQKFIDQLKTATDQKNKGNAHIQTILDNLYSIIYIASGNFDSLQKVPEKTGTTIPALYQ